MTKDKSKNSSAIYSKKEINYKTPWRPSGISYKKNELFIDLVEYITCSPYISNEIQEYSVKGIMHSESHLSGLPFITMTLNRDIH